MKDFSGHVHVKDFDAVSYLERVASPPNVDIAVSGGGYRALMNGAGALKAFDSRTSATSLSGLSGGGWLLGSLYLNNLTSVSSLQTDNLRTPWESLNSMLEGPDDGGALLSYARNMAQNSDAGYPTTITEFWTQSGSRLADLRRVRRAAPRAAAHQYLRARGCGVWYCRWCLRGFWGRLGCFDFWGWEADVKGDRQCSYSDVTTRNLNVI
ncbi:uncharacterized protein BO66DRAFT_425077 [Aspergillus aculeatinus CBS 121060]|uniref:Uncharacterized protein n=1 Tax=Aspergillus aculeatinus CBS 121060 TaxID=1448322 RepID=A0ACD1HQ59_9EURO|nr:hypothetical protein BO66DRAFT_425077 [Aspergillus aculeatinus CBS 121060]RAH75634.1 hypothetical protein BO66DRAFT_425077 [Aspergillus aculeatinus CBS 121060]